MKYLTLLFILLSLPVQQARAEDPFNYNRVIDDALNKFEEGMNPAQDKTKLLDKIEPLPSKPAAQTAPVPASPMTEIRSVIIDQFEVSQMDIPAVMKSLEIKTGIPINVIAVTDKKITVSLKKIYLTDLLRLMLEPNGLAYIYEQGRIRILSQESYSAVTGKSFTDTKTTFSKTINYIDIKALLNTFKPLLTENGRVYFNQSANKLYVIDHPSAVGVITDLVNQLDVPKVTRVFELQHIAPENLLGPVRDMLTDTIGDVQVDQEKKTITITDTDANLTDIERLIKNLDQPEKQLQLKVEIIQIILNDEYQDGVDWDAIVSKYQKIDSIHEDQVAAESLSLGIISKEDLKILVEALDTVGAVSLVTSVYKKIDFDQYDFFPISSIDFAELSSDQDLEESRQKKREASAVLNPKIIKEGSVSVNLLFDEGDEKDADRYAQPDYRKLFQNIDVQENSVIVIGGMFREGVIEHIRKIPLLGNLPLVGFAFQMQGERPLKTEIVIFITPTVVVKD